MRDGFLAIGLAWYDSPDPLFLEKRTERIGVISFVRQKIRDTRNQADTLTCHNAVSCVARGKHEHPRPTQVVDYSMNFGVATTFREPDSLRLGPPFPPAAHR
jgi:kynureninase